jgi:Lhr-like helicase
VHRRLVRRAVSGELADRTFVLYVSPLKARNDVQKNLDGPLADIPGARARAWTRGRAHPHGGAGPATR